MFTQRRMSFSLISVVAARSARPFLPPPALSNASVVLSPAAASFSAYTGPIPSISLRLATTDLLDKRPLLWS